MFVFFSQKAQQALTVIGVAVILLLAAVWGAASGKAGAQSESAAVAAKSLASGLNFFFNDENRFPSASEFADNNLMLNYFSSFPPPNFPSSACSKSFVYKRLSLTGYQLEFCLQKAAQGYRAGWNTINH